MPTTPVRPEVLDVMLPISLMSLETHPESTAGRVQLTKQWIKLETR